MEYNTARDHLIIPEYGRNIQKMVDYAITIEDREKRTEAARAIIVSMAQMNPTIKDTSDYAHVLWDHLFIISKFKLDVDGPYPPPTEEKLSKKPDTIAYSKGNHYLRHYGKNLLNMIKVAAATEEGEEKQAFAFTLANQMKKSYLKWNRDSVTDEAIIKQMNEISDGKLTLPEDAELIAISDVVQRPKKQKKKSPQKGMSQKHNPMNKRKKRK